MKLAWRLSVRLLCLWGLLACAAWGQASDSWTAPATELARQIAALTGPGSISLSVRNDSSIVASDVPVIRQRLQVGLSALGVTVRNQTATDAVTTVRVTLSQTVQHAVWVAEVQQGPETKVAMVTAVNPAPVTEPEGMPVVLRRTLVYSQSAPMLDAGLFALPGDAGTDGHLVVLSPEMIATYHRDDKADGGWVKDQSFEVAHGRAYPRDVRGRLQMEAGVIFKAYLPGVICTASQQAAGGVAVSCADSDDPWPIGSQKAFYNSSRNFFTGVITPSVGAAPGPFYSAADLQQKNGVATVYSEVSGQVRMYDGGGLKVLAGSRDWGRDVVGVQSGCGSGAQLLATASGVALQDSLRAYEAEGRNAIAVSPPLPMDGEVMAMWPMILANGSSAAPAVVAILRKQQPVRYEAYRVSVVCN